MLRVIYDMFLRQVLEERWNVILVGIVLEQGRPLPTQLSLPRVTVLGGESRVGMKERERCRTYCEKNSWVQTLQYINKQYSAAGSVVELTQTVTVLERYFII